MPDTYDPQKEVESKNAQSLASFTQYCLDHPEERFYQALRNWSGHDFIFAGNLTNRLGKPKEQAVIDGQKVYVRDTFND